MYVPQVNFRTLNFASKQGQSYRKPHHLVASGAAPLLTIITMAWYFAKKIKDNENMLLHGKYQRYLTCK